MLMASACQGSSRGPWPHPAKGIHPIEVRVPACLWSLPLRMMEVCLLLVGPFEIGCSVDAIEGHLPKRFACRYLSLGDVGPPLGGWPVA